MQLEQDDLLEVIWWDGRMPKARPYLENGYPELDKNTAEHAVKPVAIERKNWMFARSADGGKAMAFTLIETATLSSVNPQTCLARVLVQIADHKIARLDKTLPSRCAVRAAQQHRSRQSRSGSSVGHETSEAKGS